ncbi:MAG: PA2779 family protein [Deltaproteobacteria bacterium]|nr:PA2779 family protein [Deltaproteobacteria bacterium]MBW2308334.1 PA2779 family protein [Deltaproteobacteria bacterium]
MYMFLNSPLMKPVAMLLVLVMGLINFIPGVEAGFISSEESSSIARQKNMAVVQKVLEHKIVNERLRALGFGEEEITARLSRLSSAELHKLAARIDSLTAGGDGLGVVIALLVIAILVIVLIKLMNKRIVIS